MYATPINKDSRLSGNSSELSLTSSSRPRSSRLGKLRNLGLPQRSSEPCSKGPVSPGDHRPLQRIGSAHLFSAQNLDQITEGESDENECPLSRREENTPEPKRIPSKKQESPFSFSTLESSMENLSVKGRLYRPLKVLGKGGSSQVLEVIDAKGSVRAIKVVDMSGNDSEVKRSFLNEIKVLEKLQGSARVIKMYDYEYREEQGKLFVVMEKGETDLGSILRNPLSDIKIKFYWEEMLSVVKVIHQAGIIHSDLKPANFLFVAGILKIIDFGISSSVSNDHTSIITFSLGGTCNFMSPEAIQGINSEEGCTKVKIGYKSDVWSLGCILYLMTYGKTPFYDIKAQFKKCQAIVDPSHAILFPEHAKDPRLAQIISSCLNRDPAARPTVDELLVHPYLKSTNNSFCPQLSAIEQLCSPNTRQGILRAKKKLSH